MIAVNHWLNFRLPKFFQLVVLSTALWLVAATLASITTLLDTPDNMLSPPTNWQIWAGTVIYYLAWILLSPFTVGWFFRKVKLPLRMPQILKLWGIATFWWWLVLIPYRAGIATYFYNEGDSFLSALVNIRAGEWFFMGTFSQGVIITCLTLAAIRVANRAELERAQLGQTLLQAELDTLKARFDSHFLMNSLNAVAGLVRMDDNKHALRGITLLRDLLRNVLKNQQDDVAPFADEISFIETYLELQKLRFDQRLSWSTEVSADCGENLWPRLLLQPIVENAVQHGMNTVAGVQIELSASQVDSTFVVTLKNSLRPNRSKASGLGVGMEITQKRLQMLYGKRAVIHEKEYDHWYETKISIAP